MGKNIQKIEEEMLKRKKQGTKKNERKESRKRRQ
jgi:hypothetical protein